MPTLDQTRGQPTGPTRCVDGDADRQRVDDQVDERLVEVEQIVARFVVAIRPLRIGGTRRISLNKHPGVGGERLVVE
jgi:hypothetical protein